MYEIDKQKFGAFVAELRREKGCTQKELAQQLHLSDKAVSKWETGVSLPDTALLVPLAELLGVTVTELLLCCRQPNHGTLETDEVEKLVKTLVGYPGGRAERAWRSRGWWGLAYLLSALVGGAAVYTGFRLGLLEGVIWSPVLLGAIFGAYFCFFVPLRLPELYDRHPMGLFYDGVLRMNVPGLAFNNRNWPYVITVGRVWGCAAMAGLPLLSLAAAWLAPGRWAWAQLPVMLALTLGGLFVPLYVVGKRYE